MALVIADRVKETSTTTGTGALTLAGAMTGFQTFASKCAVGDTCFYVLQGVDAGGAPTGEWECGIGNYSAANTLTRTTVTSSSNGGAPVVLSAGTKQVFISVTATQASWIRERLTANRTYYVAATGSDSNNGLSAGSPFLTIQKAVDIVCGTLDLGNSNVLISVGDGTYTNPVTFGRYVAGSGTPTITGNETTPSNVIVSTTSNSCFTGAAGSGVWTITGMKLQTTTSGAPITAAAGSSIHYKAIDFGASAWGHIYAYAGGSVYADGNYSISGGAFSHWNTENAGYIQCVARTITLTGTPAFSQAFVKTDRGLGMLEVYGNTFTGAATGKRYELNGNSVCFVNGAATTYLPGDIAGTAATGGQYY